MPKIRYREGSTFAVFAPAGPLHRAGFVWPDHTENLPRGTSLVIEEPLGRGHVVLFAKLIVDTDPSANQIIAGDGILEDARTAEIHLVLRTHGPVIPGLVNHQLSTFDAGCTTAPPALTGPNTCMNLQFSVHMP